VGSNTGRRRGAISGAFSSTGAAVEVRESPDKRASEAGVSPTSSAGDVGGLEDDATGRSRFRRGGGTSDSSLMVKHLERILCPVL